jgi:quercetin dioxygenase-like cupin family protein
MKYCLEVIPVREVFPGFRGQFLHSENMTLAYWSIDADSILPAHSHHHEQVVNMLEGELELVADGIAHTLRAGDVFMIPGNVVHSGRALTSCKVLDVFSPVREDYR